MYSFNLKIRSDKFLLKFPWVSSLDMNVMIFLKTTSSTWPNVTPAFTFSTACCIFIRECMWYEFLSINFFCFFILFFSPLTSALVMEVLFWESQAQKNSTQYRTKRSYQEIINSAVTVNWLSIHHVLFFLSQLSKPSNMIHFMTLWGKVALDFAEDQNSISQQKHNPPVSCIAQFSYSQKEKGIDAIFRPLLQSDRYSTNNSG